MEIDEILSDSELELETEFDDLDLSSIDDEKDMLLEHGVYLASIPRTWYFPINSYAMFNMKNEKIFRLSKFRLQLARELIEEYGSKS